MTPASSLQAGMKFKDKNEDLVSIVSVNDSTTTLQWSGYAPQSIPTSSWGYICEQWGLSLIEHIAPTPPPFALDRWTAVDPDNLPKEPVIATDSVKTVTGVFYSNGRVSNCPHMCDDSSWLFATHYILLSDLDKLVKP